MQVSDAFAQGVDKSRLSAKTYAAFAKRLKCSVAHIRALVYVEAGKAGFWNDGNMKLLYEGHVAYRETSGHERKALVRAGLAWRAWGDVKYGGASVSRNRLKDALRIAGAKAYRWASYGIGQIMGFNAEMLGYDSAMDMFGQFKQSEANQLDGIMRFLKAKSLIEPLRNGDWKAVAYGYNGSAYAKHDYDGRLARAAAMFKAKTKAIDPWADGVLRIGDSGEAVKELQIQLNMLFDLDLEIDGDFGRATAQGVQHAQRMIGAHIDGIVGNETKAALDAYRKPEPKAVEEALRENGSQTIRNADDVKTSWTERIWTLVSTVGLGGLSINDIEPWLIAFAMVLAAAGFVYFQWRKDKKAEKIIAGRVDDAMSGTHLGRQGALL